MEDQYEYDEPRPQVRSTPYASPMFNYAGSIITLTDTTEDIKKMELVFRNQRENSEGKMVSMGPSLMNDYGINSIIGMVQATVGRITIMSNLKEDEVNSLMMMLVDTLAKDLMLNKIKYEIEDNSVRERIVYEVVNRVFICLKRAVNEGDRRFWKGSQQDIRTTVVNDGARKRGGLFSRLNPWKNR